MVGMGFDGAAPFSGKHTGVQARLKQHAPHAVYVHCQLQLACIQAANATKGIDHVYTTLMTLWKFFHYSPKCAQFLKEVQKVLNLPELKVIKPSDTRWLSHERCVKAVKMSYSAIVLALMKDRMKEPIVSDETIIDALSPSIQKRVYAIMGAMYPNLKSLATVCLTMPVTTASVERSFSEMKLIKLIYGKVAVESPKVIEFDHANYIMILTKREKVHCRSIQTSLLAFAVIAT